MSYLIYPILALAPSLIWLLFYLRKDSHPESNRMILRVFLWGIATTIPVAILQLGAERVLSAFQLERTIYSFIYFFAVVAISEEVFKYLAAKKAVFSSSELDEPLDVMLYMIIAALGFTALENLLYLWPGSYGDDFGFPQSLALAFQRFVGATFLHALVSGALGYFLARAYFEPKKSAKLMLSGFTLAVVLHGLFNFSIMEIGGWLKILVPLSILIGLALFVSWGFQRVRKMPSMCIIKTDSHGLRTD